MTQRQDDARGSERDLVGSSSEKPEIDERVIDLADVAKLGVVERNVADPQARKAELLDHLDPLKMRVGIGLFAIHARQERKHQTDTHLAGSEHVRECPVDRLELFDGRSHDLHHWPGPPTTGRVIGVGPSV